MGAAQEKDRPWAELTPPRSNGMLYLAEVTIAEALKPHGYATASIGKWHLGREAEYPEYQGFDPNIGGFKEGAAASHYSPYGIPTMENGAEGEYLADRLTAEAETFIEAHHSQPFFLYLSHYGVHTPIEGKQEYVEYFRAKVSAESGQQNPEYAAMVKSVDDSVGRIVAKLDDLSIADNTVVFLMSDNGGLLNTPQDEKITSNAPLRGGKAMLYEGGIREPLIVVWPGAATPGTVCDTPVSSIDFYPTILDMAGLPDVEGHESDGISVVPALEGKALSRDTLYWHFPRYVTLFPGYFVSPCAAIRKGDWKLIAFFEGGVELYDLAADLGETQNLAEVHPELAHKLEAELEAWLERVNAQLPAPNPDYDPAFARPQALDEFNPLGHELLRAWTFSQSTQGWTAVQDCSLVGKGGFLQVNAHGAKPRIEAPVSAPAGVFTVQVRLRCDAEMAARMYWRTEAGKGYHPSRSVYFRRCRGDGIWRTYAVRFTTATPLAGLRVELSQEEGSAAFAWMRVYR